MRRARVIAIAIACALAAPATSGGAPDACSWPMYGHDAAHTFGQTTDCASIDASNVARLVPKWFVHTPDNVTASPAVVHETVYVGSWDGTFYAVDAETGALRWEPFHIDDAHEVAFGRIVSSAAVMPFRDAGGGDVTVVLFGGGATLYALEAATGELLAKLDLDPRDEATKQAQMDDPPQVEIESSPAVVDVTVGSATERRIYVGMDVHNAADVGRTGVLALTLTQEEGGAWHLSPLWKFDPETSSVYTGLAGLTQGSGDGFGCGGVWSSPAVDAASGLVFFGTANCDNAADAKAAHELWSEAMFAISAVDGHQVWKFQPAAELPEADGLNEARLDDDFGASANLLTLADGTSLVGEGRKSAHYYARDRATGAAAWSKLAGTPGHVSAGFAIGGFIGTTAVEVDSGVAKRIVGATALPVPIARDAPPAPDAIDRATWAVRAMDPADGGSILWTYRLAGPSYGATTIANGVAFVPDTFTLTMLALDTGSGLPLWQFPLAGAPSSAAAIVGDSVYFGSGTRETDAEFKAFGDEAEELFGGTIGPHPLSPLSGIYGFELAA